VSLIIVIIIIIITIIVIIILTHCNVTETVKLSNHSVVLKSGNSPKILPQLDLPEVAGRILDFLELELRSSACMFFIINVFFVFTLMYNCCLCRQ